MSVAHRIGSWQIPTPTKEQFIEWLRKFEKIENITEKDLYFSEGRYWYDKCKEVCNCSKSKL